MNSWPFILLPPSAPMQLFRNTYPLKGSRLQKAFVPTLKYIKAALDQLPIQTLRAPSRLMSVRTRSGTSHALLGALFVPYYPNCRLLTKQLRATYVAALGFMSQFRASRHRNSPQGGQPKPRRCPGPNNQPGIRVMEWINPRRIHDL